MPNEGLSIFLFVISFFVLWAGSGLIISSVNRISLSLGIPTFFVSFFILGILTSTPEIAVGLSAVSSGRPGIFVGNLLGGTPVLFLLVVPVLAILGKGIKLSHKLSEESIFLALILSLAPFFVVLDSRVHITEGIALVGLYGIVAYKLQQKGHLINAKSMKLLKTKSFSLIDILKILLGTTVVLFASNSIVSQTLQFSEVYKIAPFYISLIVLSVGTNLPEITIAVRAIFAGQKDVALGDYLGSASANAILFGLFTILHGSEVTVNDTFIVAFIVISIGLVLFFQFSRTKHVISQKEGFVLLLLYVIFVVLELSA